MEEEIRSLEPEARSHEAGGGIVAGGDAVEQRGTGAEGAGDGGAEAASEGDAVADGAVDQSGEAEETGEDGGAEAAAGDEEAPGGAGDAVAGESASAGEDEEEPAALLPEFVEAGPGEGEAEYAGIKAVIEGIVYVTEEPVTVAQMANALQQPEDRIKQILDEIAAEFEQAHHGVTVREIAGGYKMATKPEHHEAIRNFVRSLKPPLKLSLAALETLATIAYKQPITAPEIMEIRGVQGTGVLKTLLDRKLIVNAGRKNVVGRPMLYKTTKEFLVQFGLRDLSELPSLKEFEELKRLAFSDGAEGAGEADARREATEAGSRALGLDAASEEDVEESAGAEAMEVEETAAASEPAASPDDGEFEQGLAGAEETPAESEPASMTERDVDADAGEITAAEAEQTCEQGLAGAEETASSDGAHAEAGQSAAGNDAEPEEGAAEPVING